MSAIMNGYLRSRSQLEIEKVLLEKRMNNFNFEKCEAIKYLSAKFAGLPNRTELVSLARVCSKYTGVALDREAYRRKTVLIKWFDENLDIIKKFIDRHIQIEFC